MLFSKYVLVIIDYFKNDQGIFFFFQYRSKQFLQTSVRVEDWVQLLLVVTTVDRIMTVKLHWSAVFNNGLCLKQVTTE